jgi:hypothetical protein
MQRLQARVFHPVTPGGLLDHQMAIGTNQNAYRPEFLRPSQTGNTSFVFGHVVCRLAYSLGHLGHGPPFLVGNERADSRRARVAASRAVTRDDQASIRIRRQ